MNCSLIMLRLRVQLFKFIKRDFHNICIQLVIARCLSVFNDVSVILLPVLLQLLNQLTERWSLLRQQTPTLDHQKFVPKQQSNYYYKYSIHNYNGVNGLTAFWDIVRVSPISYCQWRCVWACPGSVSLDTGLVPKRTPPNKSHQMTTKNLEIIAPTV